MGKDIGVALSGNFERGGRIEILRMLTALRKTCIGTVDGGVSPQDFIDQGFARGFHATCDFLITIRGDGAFFISVDEGRTWNTIFDPSAVAVTTGTIVYFTGNFASIPSDWILAAGQEVAQATYPDLFALIGTTFGTAADAVNDFVVPDMRAKFAMGQNNADTTLNGSLTTRNLGDVAGAQDVTLASNEIASHLHNGDRGGLGGTNCIGGSPSNTVSINNFNLANYSGGGSDNAHENMQPFLSLFPIIRT